MSKITTGQIVAITTGKDVLSYDHRINYANVRNRHNELVDTVNAASVGTTNAETTAARPYHANLKDRLDSIQLNQENYVKTGFEVSVNVSDATRIDISAGQATVAGIEVEKGYGTWTRSGATITVTENNHGRANASSIVVEVTSDATAIPLNEYVIGNSATNTFTFTGVAGGGTSGSIEFATVSNAISTPTTMRYDVVVINSDNSISIVTGNDSVDRVLGSIASTQRPLAVIDLDSSTVPVLVDGDITDCATQGCVTDYGWYFSIAAAVNSFNDRTNSVNQGTVIVRKGNYYEEVDLSGISNITIQYEAGANHYRPSNIAYCIKSDNGSGSETIGIKILNGNFYGNSKAGAIELLYFQYTDEFYIIGCRFDSNDSSTATNKNWLIDQCNNFFLDNNLNLDNSGDIDYAETDITNSTNYMEDGYYTGQVTFCGTTGQKAQMLKQGWIELTAMDDTFLRIDKDTAGSTGGTDSSAHTHSDGSYYAKVTMLNGAGEPVYVQNVNVSSWTASIKTPGATNVLSSDGLTVAADVGGTSGVASVTDNKPAYYTLIALIHR